MQHHAKQKAMSLRQQRTVVVLVVVLVLVVLLLGHRGCVRRRPWSSGGTPLLQRQAHSDFAPKT